jgi:hypothetical protein
MSAAVAVCGTTRVIEVRRSVEFEAKWCFVCRRRVRHDRVIRRDDVPEDWYGPWPAIECENGHTNGDCFPGCERTWEA